MADDAGTSDPSDANLQKKQASVLERLANRNQTRIENSVSRRSDSDSSSTSSFLLRFSDSKCAVESELAQCRLNPPEPAQLRSHLDAISASISELEKLVAQTSFSLPSYEVRASLKSISDLKQNLESLTLELLPKKKFSFKNKGAKKDPKSESKDAESVLANKQPEGSYIARDSPGIRDKEGVVVPFAEKGFDCLGNGRVDQSYLKWRWKPKNCDLPKLEVQNLLEMLRSKRVVFVGDSMSRTQWESLICLLMSGVEDKRTVYEMNGSTITKRIKYLGVRFSSFNFTIEFFRSVFLVQEGPKPKHTPKRVKSALRLDLMDSISRKWIDSDVLIFNTGHWWVPGKLYETGCYFQDGNSLKLGMSIPTAFGIALRTWASWIEENINTNRTHVFFRTFEPSHWKDHTFKYCSVTQGPVNDTEGRGESVFSDTILEVAKNMKIPINVLHITSMSAFRSDAHVGKWSDNPSVPDCSHWCLPGVPDVWNEILLSYLLTEYNSSSK